MLIYKSKIHHYLIIAFLALFACSQALSVAHNFSHQLGKKISDNFSKKEQKHNISDCAICSSFSFFANGNLFNLSSLSILYFLILTIFLVELRNKLFIFKPSPPAQAPPYFS